MAKNELTKAAEASVPTYLTKLGAQGTEGIGTTDVAMPRIKICQATSRDAKRAKVEEGNFYRTSDMAHWPKLVGFVGFAYKSRIWFSQENEMQAQAVTNPMTGQIMYSGPMAGRVQEGIDEEFLAKGQDSWNYFIVGAAAVKAAVKSGSPVEFAVLSVMGGGLKTARDLNGRFKSAGIPIWAHRLAWTTVLKEFDKGSAYIPIVSSEGYADEDEAKVLAAFYQQASAYLGKEQH